MLSKEALESEQQKKKETQLERQDQETLDKDKEKPYLRVIKGGKGPPTSTTNWLREVEVGSSFTAKFKKELYLAVRFDKVWEGSSTTLLRVHEEVSNSSEEDKSYLRYVSTSSFSYNWELLEVI